MAWCADAGLGRRIARRVALCGAALVTVLAVPPVSAGATPQSEDAVCEAAKALMDNALPQQARRLVIANLEPASANPCLMETEKAARNAIEAAEKDADNASSKISTNQAAARELIDSALKVDGENATALKLKSSLAEPSWSQKFTQRWEQLVNSVKPWRDVALAFLVVFLVMLILARFASALPKRWARSGETRRQTLWLIGLVAAVTSSFLLTFGLAAVDRSPEGGNWVLILAFGVLFGTLGVIRITEAMATRLRLSVEVRDNKGAVSEVSTGHVIALLGELGAAPPRGLEVPRGSDVTTLEGTPIAGTPEGKILAALTRLWQLITGLTPWRLRVDEECDDVHSIVITRNGHTAGSMIVDRDQLGLRAPIAREVKADAAASQGGKAAADKETPKLPDLHRFAAAAVLTTLAQHYEGFESLCGVTDWRSLGLHYVATTDYASTANVDQQRAAFGRALDIDPRNIPARVALWHSLNRNSLHPGVLGEYIKWLLETSSGDLASTDLYSLRLRVQMALIATACNRQALTPARVQGVKPSDIVAVGEDLIDALRSKEQPGQAEALAEAMRPNAGAAFLSLVGRKNPDAVDAALRSLERVRQFNPKNHYNFACLLSRQHPSLSEGKRVRKPPDYIRAVRHLRSAAVEQSLRTSMTTDPWLSRLRKTKAYRNEFLEPLQSDFLCLDPLAGNADALRAAGLDTATRLATASDWRLSRYLKIDLLVAKRLIEIGQLAAEIPATLSDFEVEIMAALLNEGIDARAALEERLGAPGGVAGLAAKVYRDITARCKAEPLSKLTKAKLARWLESYVPT
jgi:tetratricopeptide (TPR) repeat protein